ncbi:MAG: ABC transporter permease, partial [Gammaproteobacteria bacterium]
MESWRRNPRTFWVFALPPSLWLVLFFLVPLAMVWVMSFGEKVGLIDIVITWRPDNYMRALDPLYLQIFLK